MQREVVWGRYMIEVVCLERDLLIAEVVVWGRRCQEAGSGGVNRGK